MLSFFLYNRIFELFFVNTYPQYVETRHLRKKFISIKFVQTWIPHGWLTLTNLPETSDYVTWNMMNVAHIDNSILEWTNRKHFNIINSITVSLCVVSMGEKPNQFIESNLLMKYFYYMLINWKFQLFTIKDLFYKMKLTRSSNHFKQPKTHKLYYFVNVCIKVTLNTVLLHQCGIYTIMFKLVLYRNIQVQEFYSRKSECQFCMRNARFELLYRIINKI